jgi:hypothetical protein
MNTETVAQNYSGTRKWTETFKLVIGYSIRMVIAWALIFIIANIFNIEHVMEIRFANYIVMMVITYSLLKKYYLAHNKRMEYFSGFTIAFIACVLASFIYSILFFIYLNIDHNFLYFLMDQFPRKMIYPAMSISFVIFSEGFSFSVIIALALLQYFKRKRGRWTVSQK